MQWFSDDPDNLISLDYLIWAVLIILMILIIDDQDNLYDLNSSAKVLMFQMIYYDLKKHKSMQCLQCGWIR